MSSDSANSSCDSSTSAPSSPSNSSSTFDCNICLECPTDPVVTFCGHLFCWPCLYKWLNEVSLSQSTCPVCKAVVNRERIIPLYGRGKQPPRQGSNSEQFIPNRPTGQRNTSEASSRLNSSASSSTATSNVDPGTHAFHSFPQPPQSNGFSGFGILSAFFTSQFNNPYGAPTTERDLTQEQIQLATLSRFLLFIGSAIIFCLILL